MHFTKLFLVAALLSPLATTYGVKHEGGLPDVTGDAARAAVTDSKDRGTIAAVAGKRARFWEQKLTELKTKRDRMMNDRDLKSAYNDAIDKMDSELKGLHETIQKIQEDGSKRESWDEPKRDILAHLEAIREAYNRL